MTDWSDPQTLFLNITNAALGLVVLICLVPILGAIGQEVWTRVRNRGRVMAHADSHAYTAPGLGLTMADGGDPEKDEAAEENK